MDLVPSIEKRLKPARDAGIHWTGEGARRLRLGGWDWVGVRVEDEDEVGEDVALRLPAATADGRGAGRL